MFKINYFSHLLNKLTKLCTYNRHALSLQTNYHQWQFTTSQRHERASVACILARIKANDNQKPKSRQLLNLALNLKVKEIIEKILHKKHCCWLDLLRGNETTLQEPLASLLAPLKIYKIKDLAQLRNVSNSDLIGLLNKLNSELHNYECNRTKPSGSN